MKFNHSADMLTHLKSLNYNVETATDENFDWLYATSETQPPLSLRVSEGLIVVVTVFAGYDLKALETKGFLAALNKVNEETLITKWYFMDNPEQGEFNLAIRSAFREYTEVGFPDFINSHLFEIYERGRDFEPFLK